MLKTNNIMLGHGSGGRMSHDLISSLFLKYFSNEALRVAGDSAILDNPGGGLAFTTDSYVVDPLFFPGGNIGKLAVCGTVNDLAVSGARPQWLSAGFIIEEGLEIDLLERIVSSMAEAANVAGIEIVTGDTKVVNRGKCDKLFINTSGIGYIENRHTGIASGRDIRVGDVIVINGNIGDHGVAVMCARNDIRVETAIESDCAPLNDLIKRVLGVSANMKFMRDPTRGGLGTVLAEISKGRGYGIEISESAIPLQESVRGLCEFFGFDPLFVANEGKVLAVVGAEDADKVIGVMKQHHLGRNAAIIGRIVSDHPGKVIMQTIPGGKRIVDMLAGEQLPRIC